MGILLVERHVAAAELEVHVYDLAGHTLADAVVFAEPLDRPAPPPAQPVRATIDQVNKEFVPLVSVIRAGTEVFLPNSDNIRHSIYSFSAPKPFTRKLYSGKQADPVVFDNPGLVVLGCNIHDSMAAWVVVVDTPYFGKTAEDGKSVLKGLEHGEYRLNVWYPHATFEPHQERVSVSDASVERRTVNLDARGSLLPGVRARAQGGS